MIKMELYVDAASDADVGRIEEEAAAFAENCGCIRKTQIKDLSPRQIGFGDLERGEIAECLDVKLLYRRGVFIVRDVTLVWSYTNAYVAAMQFGFKIIQKLFDRITARPEWEHPRDTDVCPLCDTFADFCEYFDNDKD